MPANYRKMRKHYQQREYVETGRERGYLRIMCCCITWERGPRAYREPPPELIAARKSGFRHGASSSKAGELHGIEGSRRLVGRVRQAENLARLDPLRSPLVHEHP